MRGIKKTTALTLSVLVLTAGAVSAKTFPGSDAGEVLRGSRNADTIHGYGGADLIYAYGGRDTVWGGNEAGKGDKVLGGSATDQLIGQQGHDALYGDRQDGLRNPARLGLIGEEREAVPPVGPSASDDSAPGGLAPASDPRPGLALR